LQNLYQKIFLTNYMIRFNYYTEDGYRLKHAGMTNLVIKILLRF